MNLIKKMSRTEESRENSKQEWIRGVNIGGWLVLERFIIPYFFALTDCHLRGDFFYYKGQINAPPTSSPNYKLMDETAFTNCKPVSPYPVDQYTLTNAFNDKDIAKDYMEVHWDNFVTRDDIRKIKEDGGITHVRVPLGHWIMGDIREGEPWVNGEWPYFKRFVGWCREEGIQVWPDLHTAPGSQNGFDNSGHLLDFPTCHGWDLDNASATDDTPFPVDASGDIILSSNVLRTLKAVDDITSAIAKDGMNDVVTGFGVLNEPFANCNPKVVRKFDTMALQIVRKNMGAKTHVYIGDLFNATKWNDGFWTNEKFEGTYLDSHYYHVFDERPRHISPRQHIALVCQKNHRNTVACCHEDDPIKTIPSKGISRIIGEWSASFDTLVCDKLDVVMAGIAANGTAPEFDRQISPLRQSFLRNFVEAQMVSYEAADGGVSSGWFYWTFKMEGGAFAEWNFLRGLEEGWIPKIPLPQTASTELYGSCYDIIFRTDDDYSIVHEFPDPKSLNPNNWQGFDIDDDVVVSHGESLTMGVNGQWYDDEVTKGLSMYDGVMVTAVVLCFVGILRLCTRRYAYSRKGYYSIQDSGSIDGSLELIDED